LQNSLTQSLFIEERILATDYTENTD